VKNNEAFVLSLTNLKQNCAFQKDANDANGLLFRFIKPQISKISEISNHKSPTINKTSKERYIIEHFFAIFITAKKKLSSGIQLNKLFISG
jgi:hypothetical protein